MSETISSDFSITIRDFEILLRAVNDRKKKLLADAERCRKSYSGKASTELKAYGYKSEADELNELMSRIAQEFS